MLGLAIPPGLLIGGTSSLVAFELGHTAVIAAAVLGILTTLSTVVGIVYGVRWKIAYEVERKAREGVEALAEASAERVRGLAHERDDVVLKLDQATHALRESEKTIARLEALPNLERVLELMTSTFERITNRIDAMHDENKQAAEEQTAKVISEIRRQAA